MPLNVDKLSTGSLVVNGTEITGGLPYKVYTALLSQSGGDDPYAIITPQPLVIGQTYKINVYNSGDDFTNVGAPSNALDVLFVATGTTPAVWTNGSELFTNGGAPVVTVLENTLDEDIAYQYNQPGFYSILTPNNTFTANKTYSVLQLWADDGVSPRLGFIGWASTNELYITLTDPNGIPADTLGDNQSPVYFLTSIEIRVYN
jgi:hypothetical protein